jgi:hypothetical protein
MPDNATAPRYQTLMIPGMLGLYFFLLPRPRYRTALAVFLVLLIPASLSHGVFFSYFYDRKHAWIDCYRESGSINGCLESTKFSPYPFPDQPEFRQKLEYLKENRLNFFAEEK